MHQWLQPARSKQLWVGRAYEQYSNGKHTLVELSQRYDKSIRTIQRHFDCYEPAYPVVTAANHPVPLVFDATFFGRSYGLLVYRAEGRNVHWQEVESEKIRYIEQDLLHLKAQGWSFSSFTIDGRRGVIQCLEDLFPKTPIQLCLFHQKATIRRYTTAHPKTACGKDIRALMHDLVNLDKQSFDKRLQAIKDTHQDFLKERNENNQFMHRRLRSALRSLTTNAPFLFTCKKYPELNIPNTTNSCDGSFAHWKAKVKLHRGLRKDRRTKMINYLLAKNS